MMVRYLVAIVIGAIVGMTPVAAFNFVIDPYAYFRRPTLYHQVMSGPQRAVSAGIAKNYDYDGIAIGSSATANFRTSIMEELWGGKFAKVTMFGARPHEAASVLDVAFRTHPKIKNVIWSIDPFYWLQPADLRDGTFPEYLYRPFSLELLTRYLLSLSTAKAGVQELKASFNRQADFSFDKHQAWAGTCMFGCKTGCETVRNYVSAWVNPATQLNRNEVDRSNEASYKLSTVQQVDRYLLPFIKAHPDTVFYLFVPPTSAAEQFTIAAKDAAATIYRHNFKMRLGEIAREFPNVRFYDFNEMRSLTDNLDLYYDWQHYSVEVSDFLVKYMSKSNGLPTSSDQVDRIFERKFSIVFNQCMPQQ